MDKLGRALLITGWYSAANGTLGSGVGKSGRRKRFCGNSACPSIQNQYPARDVDDVDARTCVQDVINDWTWAAAVKAARGVLCKKSQKSCGLEQRRVSMTSPSSMLLEIRWKHEARSTKHGRTAALAQSVHSGAASPSPWTGLVGADHTGTDTTCHTLDTWAQRHKKTEYPPASMHGDSLQSPGHQPLLKTAVQDGTMCATTPAAPASRGRLRLAGGWLARSQLGSLPEDTPPSSAMLDSDGDLNMPNGNAGPRVGQDWGRLMMTGSGQTCRHGRQ